MVNGFEVINGIKVTLSACLKLKKGYVDMEWTAVATAREVLLPEQSSSVLASVSVWAGDYVTLMGLVSRLMYALDARLALNEFEKVETKKQ